MSVGMFGTTMVAMGAVVGLVLLFRWMSRRDREWGWGSEVDEHYGLLREAAVVEDRVTADVVRSVLADAGIRSTIAIDDNGFRVLVFADQLDRARTVLPRQ